MAEGLSAKGIFNGDWTKLSGTGTQGDPLKYNGKNFTGTIKWTTGATNYVNGVKVRATGTEAIKPDDEGVTGPRPEPGTEVAADGTVIVTDTSTTKSAITAAEAEAKGKAFGFIKKFLDEYPNDKKLQESWMYLLEGDETAAKLAYWESEYYKNTLTLSDSRIKRKLNQYGVYVKERDAWIDSEIKRLTLTGFTLDPKNESLLTLLEDAYLGADTQSQIDGKILAFNAGKTIGGSVGSSINDIRTYARSFGMGYSDSDYKRWSEDIFAQRTTAADIQAKIRQDAASMYPAYADALLNGESVDSIGSAYKSSYSTIMEEDPDSVDWTKTPVLKKALQFTVGGKPAIMPNWMFEQELRKDPKWQFTNNARDSVYNAVYQVKYDMGLI